MKVIKIISVALLLSVFMIANGLRTFITVSFYYNQTAIAARHCVNKDKPTLKCNGKCYLAKQLKKADAEKEQSSPVEPGRFHFPELFYDVTDLLNFTALPDEENRVPEHQTLFYQSVYTRIIAPPPEA